MTKITLKGEEINTCGTLPEPGSDTPAFTLVKTDLSSISPDDLKGKKVVLNIFPSIDTPVCASSTRRFNEELNKLDNCVVLCVSMDLPFAHKRFCEGEGLENIIPVSDFRTGAFGRDYGVRICDGPLEGLLSRAIVVIDESAKVIYTEQVPEIAQEPDFEAAIKHIQ